jgi:hypothetical protein
MIMYQAKTPTPSVGSTAKLYLAGAALGLTLLALPVCTENLNPGVVMMEAA